MINRWKRKQNLDFPNIELKTFRDWREIKLEEITHFYDITGVDITRVKQLPVI